MRLSFHSAALCSAAITLAACQVFAGPEMKFDGLAGLDRVVEAGAAGGRALGSLTSAAKPDSQPLPDAAPAASLQARVEALFDAYPVSQTVRNGAGFAGRYGVKLEACGMGCQTIRLVDMATGDQIEGPSATTGARWRADSLLMIVNDPYALGGFAPADIPPRHWPRCYWLQKAALVQTGCSIEKE